MEEGKIEDMFFNVTKRINVDYSHRLMNHCGKCKSIHGHTATIEVTCSSCVLDQQGMVVDFGDLKSIIDTVVKDSIDHTAVLYIKDEDILNAYIVSYKTSYVASCISKSLIEKGYWRSQDFPEIKTLGNSKLFVVPFIPTSENFSAHFFNRLSNFINKNFHNVKVTNVRFYETKDSWADYPGYVGQ